jgi:hypothetical protein
MRARECEQKLEEQYGLVEQKLEYVWVYDFFS